MGNNRELQVIKSITNKMMNEIVTIQKLQESTQTTQPEGFAFFIKKVSLLKQELFFQKI